MLGLGGADDTFVTGRGPDGRLHLWSIDEYSNGPGGEPLIDEAPMSRRGPAYEWAVPIVDDRSSRLLGAFPSDDGWQLEVRSLGSVDPVSDGHRLRIGGPPDRRLKVAHHGKSGLWVAGAVEATSNEAATAWWIDTYSMEEAQSEIAWAEAVIQPPPTALTSIVQTIGHTFTSGHDGQRPLVYQARHNRRFSPVPAPDTRLSETSVEDSGGSSVLLVDAPYAKHPALFTASDDGNYFWRAEGERWRRIEAPAGALRSSSFARGRIWAHIGSEVWSLPSEAPGMPDPIGS